MFARPTSLTGYAEDLGVSESGLRRWMVQDAIDIGHKEGLSFKERVNGPGLGADNRRLERLSAAVPVSRRRWRP